MSNSRERLIGHPAPRACVRAALGVLTALIAGCTVGPDYRTPDTRTQEGWTGDAQRASGRQIGSLTNAGDADVRQWWSVFNDAQLTRLIERADAGNLTLAQAQARVRQARAARTVSESGLFPQVSAGVSGERSRTPGSRGQSASTDNFFRAGFDATWELDVFGGIRRGVEAADADLLAAGFDVENTRVSLLSEVAATYLDLRGAQLQLEIARQNAEAQQRTLVLTQQRLDAGFVSALDVANARANATQTESQIPAYDAQVRASIYALSVLVGEPPATLLEELTPSAPLPALPAEVAVGVPSDVLQRRPDIRQAEAALRAATARIGVAVADQFPRFSLTGSFGTQGRNAESLGTLAARAWSFGPAVSVPVFTGGRISGNIEQARALAEQATLAYRQSVLVALRDVETALANYSREQQRASALEESAQANKRAVELSLELYNAGRTDFLNVLSAQRQQYQTQAQLVQSRTQVATNLVALYKALGGGWSPADSAGVEPMAQH